MDLKCSKYSRGYIMGAKDTMKTFFAAMNEAVVPTRGYGPKIISTPMGPFSWNDNLQTWVNTNNGMQMNNIAFQDMYAMMDYATLGGGGGPADDRSPYDINPVLTPSLWGVITGITAGASSTTYWSGVTKATSQLSLGTNVVFTDIEMPITINAKWTQTAGYVPDILNKIYYSLNGGSPLKLLNTSVQNNDGIRIGILIDSGLTAGITGSGLLQIINSSSGQVLSGITYSLP